LNYYLKIAITFVNLEGFLFLQLLDNWCLLRFDCHCKSLLFIISILLFDT